MRVCACVWVACKNKAPRVFCSAQHANQGNKHSHEREHLLRARQTKNRRQRERRVKTTQKVKQKRPRACVCVAREQGASPSSPLSLILLSLPLSISIRGGGELGELRDLRVQAVGALGPWHRERAPRHFSGRRRQFDVVAARKVRQQGLGLHDVHLRALLFFSCFFVVCFVFFVIG